MFYSQIGQDRYVRNRFFPEKADGYFVEIGAEDGVRFSNCKHFEDLGWSGIAIEARDSAYEKLKRNRTCKCIHATLFSRETTVNFLDIGGFGKGLSGIVDSYDPRHQSRIDAQCASRETTKKEVVSKTTRKLSDILQEQRVSHIDFLSIDTEGSELAILETVDFKKVKIDVIAIEDNYNSRDLTQFFLSRGYKLDKAIQWDKIFVLKK